MALVFGDGPDVEGPSFAAMGVAFAVVYGAAGAALAAHGVARVVRRVMLGVGLVHGLGGLVARYADTGLHAQPDWPFAEGAL